MVEEPNERLLHTPVRCYWLATRPAFLAASVVPALVGAAAAWAQGYALHGWLLVWTVLAVMLVHAGMNVLNDYYDEQNGTDRRNTQRLFPFTGGSRFIQ
ncbi:MAG: 1,4-dihydroxy-2-naphthoate octaprenyltransferase, partial [Thiothrix lacustris]